MDLLSGACRCLWEQNKIFSLKTNWLAPRVPIAWTLKLGLSRYIMSSKGQFKKELYNYWRNLEWGTEYWTRHRDCRQGQTYVINRNNCRQGQTHVINRNNHHPNPLTPIGNGRALTDLSRMQWCWFLITMKIKNCRFSHLPCCPLWSIAHQVSITCQICHSQGFASNEKIYQQQNYPAWFQHKSSLLVLHSFCTVRRTTLHGSSINASLLAHHSLCTVLGKTLYDQWEDTEAFMWVFMCNESNT